MNFYLIALGGVLNYKHFGMLPHALRTLVFSSFMRNPTYSNPYHSRVQYYQATSPSPTTYLVSSNERRIESPMSHSQNNQFPGYLRSPASSPISSTRENDSECDRVRRNRYFSNYIQIKPIVFYMYSTIL